MNSASTKDSGLASGLVSAEAEVRRFDASLPVERAVTPPASWYRDPGVLELELRRVFGRAWQVTAPAQRLRDEGAFVAGQVGREPYVVVRHQGQLRAFYNVCRHHAACVAPSSGQCEAFVCPYHGWTYHLDGRLKSAPRMAGVQDFRKEEMGLRPMAVEEVGPLVFVSPDPRAAPRTPSLAPLLGPLEEGGWSSLVHLRTVTYELACNWKVFVDNYLDGGYHVAGLHPALASELDLDGYRTEVFAPGVMHGFSVQTSEGAVGRRVGQGALYAFLFPNVMVNRYGDCLDVNVAIPLGPDRCRVVFDYFFTAAAAADEEGLARSLAASDVVQQEDITICESVQRGLQSSAYGVGRYAPRVEHAMHAFHVELAAALLPGSEAE